MEHLSLLQQARTEPVCSHLRRHGHDGPGTPSTANVCGLAPKLTRGAEWHASQKTCVRSLPEIGARGHRRHGKRMPGACRQ
eukprot:2495376-Rhodomonas_salina.2